MDAQRQSTGNTVLSVGGSGSAQGRNQILRAAGLEVIEVPTCLDALTLAGSLQPAIIITEIPLAGLKADPATAPIPILLVRDSRQAGPAPPEVHQVDATVTEPVEPPMLVALVQALVRAAAAERQCGTLKQGAIETTQALRESEQRFRRVIEHMHDALIIDDASGKLVFANPRFFQLFGIPFGEVDTIRLEDCVAPEWREQLRDRHDRRMRGESVPTHFEYEGVRRDGTRMWLSVGVVPIAGEDGRVTGTQSAIRDITERRRAEQALRESESRYRGLVDLAPDAVLVHQDGLIVYSNAAAAQLYGASGPEELRMKELLAIVHPEDRDLARARIRGALRGDVAPLRELRHVRLDGQAVPVETTAASVIWQGRPAVQVIVRDMTGRKRAEERLLQAQKLESVGLLAGGVAHDFNNLLATIMGNASLLAGDVTDRNQEHVEAILHASQRAADLTRQLLAYAGKGRYVIEPVNLSAMVRDLARLLRASIPKRVALVEALAAELPAIQADRGQIQQIIMNLVLNASEAMPETGQGEIEVRTSVEALTEAATVVDAVTGEIMDPGQYVCLEVRDTGSGMDGPTRAKIFDPFFTTKFAGRGLGLAAAAGVVKAHHGAILVSSAPGQGATFRVFLPASTEARHAEPSPPPGDLRGSGTVLVVDDEPMVRRFIRTALGRYGYEVLTATDGHNAIQVFENHSGTIDLVLLDLMMPVLGGGEAITRIRAKSPGVKVILMSGYSEMEAERLFAPAGPGSFLQKPFTSGSLAQQVKAVLGSR